MFVSGCPECRGVAPKTSTAASETPQGSPGIAGVHAVDRAPSDVDGTSGPRKRRLPEGMPEGLSSTFRAGLMRPTSATAGPS